MTLCPYCAQDVPAATFPWQFQRHDIHGMALGTQATSLCVGSRNVYTLDLLGLREIEPDLVPKKSTGFASTNPDAIAGRVAS